MTYFEVLVEGYSDVPTIREILTRRFKLEDKVDFRIHPHKGRGRLPQDLLAQPDPRQQTLLHQLPAKLKGFSYLGENACVVVLVDLDNDDPVALMNELDSLSSKLPQFPKRVLFRLAIEETESWFIADTQAVQTAYPRAKIQKLKGIEPDAVVGAWEKLADALKLNVNSVSGTDKVEWANAIAPHMDLFQAKSPSLQAVIDGIHNELLLPESAKLQ